VASDNERLLQAAEGGDPDWMEKAASQLPFGRLIDPEEAARAVNFLVSDDALIANILSNRSGVVSRIVPRSVDAQAFTSTFTRPKTLVGFRDHASEILHRPEIAAHEERGNARSRGDSLGNCVATIFVAPGHDNHRAGCRQSPGDRCAEILCRAGDHAHLVIHAIHRTTS
jgi:hypothetical protein